MSLLLSAEAADDLNVLLRPLVAEQTIVTVSEICGWRGQGIIVDTDFEGIEFVAVPAETVTDSVSWEVIATLVRSHPELHTTRRIAWDQLAGVHIW